ncbi:MAG: urease accessory protein [Rhodospirillaceae bacterium]|nr:urease accessory protein [Rhodospirillaceae bacterium]
MTVETRSPHPNAERLSEAAPRLQSGSADLQFLSRHGRTFLARQRLGYPFHVTRVFHLDSAPAEMATLYLQSLSGGLFRGDRLTIDCAVGEGAAAHVTTQAATKVHSMVEGRAEQQTTLTVAEGAILEWIADPLILFPDAEIETETKATMPETATLVLGESYLAHDPAGDRRPFRRLGVQTTIARPDGTPLLHDRLDIDGTTFLGGFPGITGPHAVQGTVFVLSPLATSDALVATMRQALEGRTGVYAGASALPRGIGAWSRILAEDGALFRAAYTAVWSAVRCALTGVTPPIRRK